MNEIVPAGEDIDLELLGTLVPLQPPDPVTAGVDRQVDFVPFAFDDEVRFRLGSLFGCLLGSFLGVLLCAYRWRSCFGHFEILSEGELGRLKQDRAAPVVACQSMLGMVG